jgi:hypothetical protein
VSPPADNLAAHLRNARLHLATSVKALERCRDHVHTAQADRELTELARYAKLIRRHLLQIGRREIKSTWPR